MNIYNKTHYLLFRQIVGFVFRLSILTKNLHYAFLSHSYTNGAVKIPMGLT